METETKDSDQAKERSNKTKVVMNIEGYPVKGLSIAGHETCIIFPTLNLAFDIGRCPHQAIQQDFLCISHAHMDHIVSPFSAFSLCFLFCSGFSIYFMLLSICFDVVGDIFNLA